MTDPLFRDILSFTNYLRMLDPRDITPEERAALRDLYDTLVRWLEEARA